MAMGNHRQAVDLIPRKLLVDALAPALRVVSDAFVTGGKIAASEVESL